MNRIAKKIDLLEHIRVEVNENSEFHRDEITVTLTCHGLSDRTDVLGWTFWKTVRNRILIKRFVAALTDGALFDRCNFEVLTDTGGKTYIRLLWVEWPSGKYLNSVLRKVGY